MYCNRKEVFHRLSSKDALKNNPWRPVPVSRQELKPLPLSYLPKSCAGTCFDWPRLIGSDKLIFHNKSSISNKIKGHSKSNSNGLSSMSKSNGFNLQNRSDCFPHSKQFYNLRKFYFCLVPVSKCQNNFYTEKLCGFFLPFYCISSPACMRASEYSTYRRDKSSLPEI